MSKRRAPADVPPEVDDSKKPKQDPPSEKVTEEKPDKVTDEIRETPAPVPEALEYIQIIVTGPKGCGKSCLVLSFMGQLFPPSRVEFLSKQYLHIRPNGQSVMIWDLDSRGELERYRMQSYNEADVALVCFDVGKKAEGNVCDLECLLRPWLEELEKYCDTPAASDKPFPIFLVGLKSDSKSSSKFIHNQDEINHVLRRYPNIRAYKEVSAHWNRGGVNELFRIAIDSIDKPNPKRMFVNGGFEIIGSRGFL